MKSIAVAIGRPFRVSQTLSYSAWTCSWVGCAGRSIPNKRRHVSAMATACWFSDFMTWDWTFRRKTAAWSTFDVPRCNNSTIRRSAFSKLPLRSSHPARSSDTLNVNSYWRPQPLSSRSAMPVEKYASADANAVDALAFRPARRLIVATRAFSSRSISSVAPIEVVRDIEQLLGELVRRNAFQQHAADAQVDFGTAVFGNQHISRLLDPVMQEFVDATLLDDEASADGLPECLVYRPRFFTVNQGQSGDLGDVA